MIINWYKCTGNTWCDLFKLDLTSKYLHGLSGVYILWTKVNDDIITIKVGYGNIIAETSLCKKELAIIAFASKGIFLTWAEVPQAKQKSVAGYLISKLQPKIDKFIPPGERIEVNMPWNLE